MKSPKTADAKFNAVYKELKIAIGDTHTDLEILDMTRALLDIQKEDMFQVKFIKHGNTLKKSRLLGRTLVFQ